MMGPNGDDNVRTVDDHEAVHSPRRNRQTASQSSDPHINDDDIDMLGGGPNLDRLIESITNAAGDNVNPAASAMERGKSGAHMNFMPPSSTNAPSVNSHGAEASARSGVPHGLNFMVERIRNDVRMVRPLSDSSQTIDRSFLSLGGANIPSRIRTNRNFSTGHIAARLPDSSPSLRGFSPLGQNPNNVMDLAQLRGRSASTQAAEFPNSSDIGSTSRSLFSPLQEAMFGPEFAYSGKHDAATFDSSSPTRPTGNALTFEPGQVISSPLTPESSKKSEVAGQPIPWQQPSRPDRAQKAEIAGQTLTWEELFMNMPAESSTTHHPGLHSGNPTRYGQLGNVTRPVEGMHTRIAPNDSFMPQLHQLRPMTPQIPSFPSRLGIQPNDVAAARITRGPQSPFQNYHGSGYMQRPVEPPISLGPRPIHVAPHLNPFRPVASSPGQLPHSTVQVQSQNPFARVHNNPGAQVIPPAARFDVRPRFIPPPPPIPLKRGAAENLSTAPVSQRRKIFPPKPNQMLQQEQSLADPEPPLHVKWKGFDDPLELLGHKCLLCKRDLSFTAEEGPVYQPDRPPAVAVLQCGHVFHDLCLERITPSDQTKSPPCIPCAMGE